LQFQTEVGGETVRHLQMERLRAADEVRDAGPGHAGFALQGLLIRPAALDGLRDRPPQRLADRRQPGAITQDV
jgi:hypothetical protein